MKKILIIKIHNLIAQMSLSSPINGLVCFLLCMLFYMVGLVWHIQCYIPFLFYMTAQQYPMPLNAHFRYHFKEVAYT